MRSAVATWRGRLSITCVEQCSSQLGNNQHRTRTPPGTLSEGPLSATHFDSVAERENMNSGILSAASPSCLWPWHAFPFLFHHPTEDSPRAFFALGHSVPIPLPPRQSHLRYLHRTRCMPESKLRRPGVYSTPDAKPPPKPPVTPEHSKLKGPAPGGWLIINHRQWWQHLS